MIVYDFTKYKEIVKIENSKYMVYGGNLVAGPFEWINEVLENLKERSS
jgi:hypothetical protein